MSSLRNKEFLFTEQSWNTTGQDPAGQYPTEESADWLMHQLFYIHSKRGIYEILTPNLYFT